MRSRTMIVLPICLALGLAGFSGACKKGTAEKAGEKIDDALEGKGPAQRTGERIDKAAQSTQDAVQDLKDTVKDD